MKSIKQEVKGEILKFEGQGTNTIYNPSAPFILENKEHIAVRVEPLEDHLDSLIKFFTRNDEIYKLNEEFPSFELQDPALTIIDKKYLLAGVNAFMKENELYWETEFYVGEDLKNLQYLCTGPLGMKDIRLVDLEDKIGVFTRPMGGKFKGGRIGYTELNSLEDFIKMKDEDYINAPIIEGIAEDEQWTGVNQAIMLDKKNIGVIAHIAYRTREKGISQRHYKAISFIFDRTQNSIKDLKVIATRKDFPEMPSKSSPDLDDVVFPGGIFFDNNECWLYVGLSDYCCGRINIKNPF